MGKRVYEGRYYARRLRQGRVESGKWQGMISGYFPRKGGGTCSFMPVRLRHETGIFIRRHSSLVPRPSRSVPHSVKFIGELIESVQFDGFAYAPHQVLIIVQIMNRIQSRPQNLTAFVQVA